MIDVQVEFLYDLVHNLIISSTRPQPEIFAHPCNTERCLCSFDKFSFCSFLCLTFFCSKVRICRADIWHKNKNPSRNSFQEGSCASDGNRTRTDIAVHGIFLLLLLLHKPASSVMLSRCSLDYFLTMRVLRLGPPCIVSTPFIS